MRARWRKGVLTWTILGALGGVIALGLIKDKPSSVSPLTVHGESGERKGEHHADLRGNEQSFGPGDSGGTRSTVTAPAPLPMESPSEDNPEEPGASDLSVFVYGSEAVISRRTPDGFLALEFPLLQPTEEENREFLVFGKKEGSDPNLIMVHVHQWEEPDDLPMMLDLDLWRRFDQVVITMPEHRGEDARFLASISREGFETRLKCPGTASAPCDVVRYTSVDPNGFLTKRYSHIDPGGMIEIGRDQAGLVSLVDIEGN